jgi:aminopeptidase-like protein
VTESKALRTMALLPSCAARLEEEGIGNKIFGLAAEIYPICRSISGNGVRQTLEHIARHVDIEIHEVATGTQVFDWVVPREWNIRDAYIKSSTGERVLDFYDSNLHVLNYSTPVRLTLPLDQLKQHIFTLPQQPDLIPYRTSYYEVCIDSRLEDGSLTYGEFVHRGTTDEEVLLSTHVCHPSLANDNCSGLALLAHLAERISRLNTRYSYRFLFAPGTIGAITWLDRNQKTVGHIKHGLVVSCVGDGAGPTYKRSRRGDALIDRAMVNVLDHRDGPSNILDFFPYGYDERQYCSPGFNLPVGLFQRGQFGTFPEYHTSADNLDFIKPAYLSESYKIIASVLDILETNVYLTNTNPFCEPQLGRRGLYAAIGGDKSDPAKSLALLWVLNFSDGKHSLLDIAERAQMPFARAAEAARLLAAQGLLV